MKTWICSTALVALMGVALTAQAYDFDRSGGCSRATLQGAYSFTISGQILGGPSPGPINGVAVTTFDGQGGLSQTDFVVKSGAPAGPADAFRTGETGTYTVNADCTGTFTVDFPDAVPDIKLGERRLALDEFISLQRDILARRKKFEARARGLHVRFEASVAGGIPVLRALQEGLAGDRLVEVASELLDSEHVAA